MADHSSALVIWAQQHQQLMSEGDFLEEFEDLAAREDAFAYPIHHLKPRR